MHRISYFFTLLFLIASCDTNKKEVKIEEAPVMYEASEMALLMRGMYEFNKAARAQIINKDSLLPFPEEFLLIHKAVLTDPSERDKEFDTIAEQFINAQKATFSAKSDSTLYHFNKSVNLCISCHETRCIGPIPKIKKLLIH